MVVGQRCRAPGQAPSGSLGEECDVLWRPRFLTQKLYNTNVWRVSWRLSSRHSLPGPSWWPSRWARGWWRTGRLGTTPAWPRAPGPPRLRPPCWTPARSAGSLIFVGILFAFLKRLRPPHPAQWSVAQCSRTPKMKNELEINTKKNRAYDAPRTGKSRGTNRRRELSRCTTTP